MMVLTVVESTTRTGIDVFKLRLCHVLMRAVGMIGTKQPDILSFVAGNSSSARYLSIGGPAAVINDRRPDDA
jgi:hypothetical protein